MRPPLGITLGAGAPRAGEAHALSAWIASGACQSDSGAFCAWLDRSRGELAFEYPEITGYALTLLANLGPLGKRATEVRQSAADWLVARLEVGNYSARDGWDGEAAYNFDLAMMATGLLRFGAVSGGTRPTEWGLVLADRLREQVSFEGRVPAVHVGRGCVSTRPAVWSNEGAAHLVKLTQCLLLAGRSGLEGTREVAASIVEYSRRFQHFDGRFQTGPDDSVTMLHPHLYAAEGLWVFGVAEGDADALDRARTATRWAWRQQLESGGFPRATRSIGGRHVALPIEQLDVTAQAVRLAIVLGLDEPRMPDAIARLREKAEPTPGGLAMPYQPFADVRHLNAWATMFAAQAVDLASGARPSLAWMELV